MTLYTDGSIGTLVSGVQTWLNALKGSIPTDVSFTYTGEGEIIDEDDGVASGVWTSGSPWTVTGTSGGAYMLGVGFQTRWATGGIVAGKKVKGRTFIVPCAGSAFGADGTMDPTSKGVFEAAANALVTSTAGHMVVWSRPFAGAAGPPARPARLGSAHPVTSATVSHLPTWLTTRKH